MKKAIGIFLWLTLTCLGAYASSSGKAIENFKNLQYEMLFESDSIFLEWDNKKIIEAGKKANLYGSIRNSLKEKRLEAQEKKVIVEEKIFSLEISLWQLEWDIRKTIMEIEDLNEQVIEVNKNINIAKTTIEVMTKKVAKSEESLKKYITHIYAKSNSLYQWEDIDNLKAILLNWEDIGYLLSENHYKTLIQITGKQLLDKHRTYLRELYVKRMELQNSMTELKGLRKQEIVTKKTLNDKKELQKKLVEVSKWEQAVYEEYIKNKIAIERELTQKQLKEQIKFEEIKEKILWDYNCEYVNVNVQTDAKEFLSEKCYDLNRAIYAESKLKDEEVTWVNFLSWPVAPVNGISAYYADPEYIQALGTDHGALDIPVNQWTDIMASADGYVIYILPPTSEEYAYIALKHSNGYVTVYGHVNEILVEKYDFVERGEVFAKSWWEPWTTWAGYLSTGPHLHFEVFYEQTRSDPMEFIDTSILDINTIPEKHVYKFYGDFQARMWYEYEWTPRDNKVFRLDWANEIERQKSLLSKYAANSFKNWDIWVEESIDWWIDPTFVMCIGLAETGLGRNMKTPFNVWNVWNTDSGATLTFDSARTWIYVMVKWLNNKYLSQYDEVRMLSRYGNKDESKPIYASSPDHWHNNIIKCMSAIKWKYVPDSYNFRLWN